MGKPEAIILTLAVGFFGMYPGGEKQCRENLENLNESDEHQFSQLCGSGIPKIIVPYCYLAFNKKVQYRCEVSKYVRCYKGNFFDGSITRYMWNANIVIMQGPVIPAPYDIPMRGFQGFRYSELLF